jgi:hypothetical protein
LKGRFALIAVFLILLPAFVAASTSSGRYDALTGPYDVVFEVPTGASNATLSIMDDLSPRTGFTVCVSTADPRTESSACNQSSAHYQYGVNDDGSNHAFLDILHARWFVDVQPFAAETRSSGLPVAIGTSGTVSITFA